MRWLAAWLRCCVLCHAVLQVRDDVVSGFFRPGAGAGVIDLRDMLHQHPAQLSRL
jgi:hypothetical protein